MSSTKRGNAVPIFNDTEFKDLTGHSYHRSRDAIIASNGDIGATNVAVTGVVVNVYTQTIYAYLASPNTGSIRIDCCVICKE